MARPPITRLRDEEVSDSLDRELRNLLSICFTKPEDEVFRRRRYWKEPPTYRWIMRNAGGDLIAHAAAHDKLIRVRGSVPGAGESEPRAGETPTELRVAGMAEVAVHPAARGMGHVKELLGVAHPALERMGFDFALLFGRRAVYRSSGYRIADNPIHYYDDKAGEWKTERFNLPEEGCLMYRPLNRTDWPRGTVDVGGHRF
jgi:ribosomal protein S18 acetylase RimI-like enzyme